MLFSGLGLGHSVVALVVTAVTAVAGVPGSLQGGEKLKAALEKIATKLKKSGTLRVGFLEDASYPNGTPVAYIASIQEFGATINMPERSQTIYRKSRKARKASKNGNRFVKASAKGAVATEVDVAAHTVTIPARPFFRQMIAGNKADWSPQLGKILKGQDYDAEAALKLMGVNMEGQLEKSIQDFSDPPNAKSTIAKKGFNQPLIDTGDMKRAVGSDIQGKAE